MAKVRLRSEQIYQAMVDDEAFAELPTLLAQSIGARSCVIHWRDAREQAEILSHSHYFADAHMLDYAVKTLGTIRWQRADVAEFLGRYLSEPKQHVVFSAPSHPLSRVAFLRRLAQATVRLDPRTRLLACGKKFYLNGTSIAASGAGRTALLALADRRRVDGSRLARGLDVDLIFDWYRQGLLDLERSR